jgi:sugar lactone lactonase YvrE
MNKKYLFPLIIMAIALIYVQCSGTKKAEKFEMVWEAEGFDTPECVIYDATNQVYYVSNIGGKDPLNKDENGFISVLNPDGSIKTLKFITGLNAPKGMSIYNGMLFVTDIDKVVKIDIKKGKIAKEIPIDSAAFLNDIAIDKHGILYISDSQLNKFFRVDDTTYTSFLIDTAFKFPNGIIYDDNMLVSGVGNKVIKIDPRTGDWSGFIDETGAVDGLAKIKKGVYIISDWQGKIHLIYPDKEKELLLDTSTTEGDNAADLCYRDDRRLVVVAKFFKNTVVCYRLTL